MSRKFFIILVAAILFAGCSSSKRTAVCFYQSVIERAALPVISFDALNFMSGGKPRLDVLFHIPIKSLKFQKAENGFTASYTVTARILTDDEKQIAIQEWSKTVTVNDYRRTISEDRDATLKVFTIPPGNYTLTVTILDEQSQHQQEKSREVFVRTPAESFEVSDIVLLQKITEEQGVKIITPILPADIGHSSSFSTFIEVYDSLRTDTLHVNSRVASYHIDYEKRQRNSPYAFKSAILQRDVFTPQFDSVVAHSDTVIISENPPTQFFQTFTVPPPGRYQLVTEVARKGKGKTDTLMIGRIFTVHSRDFPNVIDTDDLIGPLQYITREEEFDSLRVLAAKEERARRVEEFWETKLDPARREEFAERVRKANEFFSGAVDGWRTPMGMVYIVAGPPSDFQCQPGSSETWYYDYQQGYVSFAFQTVPGLQSDGRRFYTLAGYPSENIWYSFIRRWRK
jgi:GWxTD domain-containing protein